MGDLFVPLSVESINWNPHPPTVGVRCVTEASDNHGGALTEAEVKLVYLLFIEKLFLMKH
jgi:hypothetical protein